MYMMLYFHNCWTKTEWSMNCKINRFYVAEFQVKKWLRSVIDTSHIQYCNCTELMCYLFKLHANYFCDHTGVIHSFTVDSFFPLKENRSRAVVSPFLILTVLIKDTGSFLTCSPCTVKELFLNKRYLLKTSVCLDQTQTRVGGVKMTISADNEDAHFRIWVCERYQYKKKVRTFCKTQINENYPLKARMRRGSPLCQTHACIKNVTTWAQEHFVKPSQVLFTFLQRSNFFGFGVQYKPCLGFM